MKLILLPVGILLLLSVLSITGLGTTTADASNGFTFYDPRTSTDNAGNLLILYDNTGAATCYWNGTEYNADNGWIVKNAYTNIADWRNSSGAYALYYDTEQSEAVNWADMQGTLGFGASSRVDPNGNVPSITFTDSLSWVAVIIAIMGVGTLVGIKVFGSGESEISVHLILIGTFYLTIWGILTAMAYPLILESGIYIYFAYFAMALMYVIGIIQSVGGGADD